MWTLPCNKVDSRDAANVDRAEMKGRGTGISEIDTLITGNEDRYGGRWIIKGRIGVDSSLDVIRGKSKMFSNLEDVPSQIPSIGGIGTVGAKRTVEGGGKGTKIFGTEAELKT